MRKKLSGQIYLLLKEFIPELLVDDEPGFYLIHKSKRKILGRTRDFQVEVDWHTKDQVYIVAGYYYSIFSEWIDEQGDFVSDPGIEVIFDNEKKIARAKSFDQTGVYYAYYDCTIDSKETKDEIMSNNMLKSLLEILISYRKNDPNFFERIPYSD